MKKILTITILAFLLAELSAGRRVVPKFKPLTAPCPEVTEIDLKKGGYIFVPKSKNYRKPGNDLLDFLQKQGLNNFSLISDLTILEKHPKNVIALGQMMNNPLIEWLYWNYYTLVNPTYPGKEGFVIETVFTPLPVLPRHSVIVLGGSNLRTVRQAAGQFIRKTPKSLVWPSTLLVKGYSLDKRQDEYIEKIKKNPKKTQLLDFQILTTLYHETGNVKFRNLALKVLMCNIRDFERKRNRYVVTWKDEKASMEIMCAWDFLQEHCKLPPAERLRIDNFFLQLISRLMTHAALLNRNQLTPEWTASYNHTTIPLLGIFTIARYMLAHYQLEAVRKYIRAADMVFMGQSKSYLPIEDAPSYSALSIEKCLKYYLMERRLDYLKNGNLKKFLDYQFAHINNNNYLAATGDVPSVYFWGFPRRATDILECYSGDPGIQWFNKQNPDADRKYVSSYYPNMPPAPPKRLLGAKVIPMPQGYYEFMKTGLQNKIWNLGYLLPNIPLEKAFTRLQFRSSFKPEGEHLLLDGLGRTNHGHDDTNSIVAYTAGGYKFLIDGDYKDQKSTGHTMITVLKNGKNPNPPQTLAALEEIVEFKDCTFTRTSIKDYNGTDWDRNILWFKDKFFLVVDSLTTRDDADFTFFNVWKLLNRGHDEFDGQNMICRAPFAKDPVKRTPFQTFHLNCADRDISILKRHRSTNEDISAHLVNQVRKGKLAKGGTMSFQNIFYIDRKDKKQYRPLRISEQALLIDTVPDDPALVILDNAAVPPFGFKGKLTLVSAHRLILFDGSEFKLREKDVFKLSHNASASIEGKVMEVIANLPGSGSLELDGKPFTFRFGKGKTKVKLPKKFELAIKNDLKKLQDKSRKLEANGKKTHTKNIPELTTAYVSPPGKLPPLSAYDLVTADLDKDGKDEIITAAGNRITCRNQDGSIKWRFNNDCPVMSLAAANLDGTEKVLAGTKDGRLMLLDKNGNKEKEVKVPIESSGRRYGTRTGQWIPRIVTNDINRDGSPEIIIGMKAWQVQIYNRNLKRLWYYSLAKHGPTGIKIIDYNHDGKKDILLSTAGRDAYILDWQEKDPIKPAYTMIVQGGGNIAATAGNGKFMDILTASKDGRLIAFKFDGKRYRPDWTFNNIGFAYSAIATAKTASREIVFPGSDTGFIYALDAANGKELWRKDLGSGVSEILVLPDGEILSGTNAGKVQTLDKQGNITAEFRMPDRIDKIRKLKNGKIAVLDTCGNLAILNKPETR